MASVSTQWLLAAQDRLKGLRVLLVDDHEDLLTSMAAIVGTLGCDVQTCSRGDLACEATQRFQPDVVLLDIAMPGMDGVEVAHQLRAASRNRRLTIVALSGFSEDVIRRSAGDGDFDDYLIKPVSLTDFYAVLRKCVRN